MSVGGNDDEKIVRSWCSDMLHTQTTISWIKMNLNNICEAKQELSMSAADDSNEVIIKQDSFPLKVSGLHSFKYDVDSWRHFISVVSMNVCWRMYQR